MSDRDQKCVQLRAKGHSHKEIAKKLGIHHVTVWKILKKANGTAHSAEKPTQKLTRSAPNGEYQFVATDLRERANDLRQQSDKLMQLAAEVDSYKA